MSAIPEFVLFGPAHLVTVAVCLGLGLALALWARRLAPVAQQRVANWTALLLVVYRTGWIVDRWLHHGEPLVALIPFHLCAIMFYLCAWMLWKRSYRLYEVTYFWAMVGSLLSMVTPDLAKGFPHPEFLEYFISHGALIAALFFATLVFGFRPAYASVWKAWLACLLYAACLLPINWLLDTNFMYLLHKPAEPTLLDVMGPWPWYLLTGAGVALVSFFFWYLPFAVAARYSASAGSVVSSGG